MSEGLRAVINSPRMYGVRKECLTVVGMEIDIGATDAQSSELDVDSRGLSD